MERKKLGNRLITPEMIYGGDLNLNNEIFVFGSNVDGIHGSGSAKTAVEHYGAIYGQGYGIQGQSYAIATIDLKKGLRTVSLNNIRDQIKRFIEYTCENSHLTFWMTKIGTNLAGYTLKEIQEIFFEFDFPYNVALPIEFCQVYEVERSFLIKNIPTFFKENSEVSHIEQFYTESGERYRIQRFKTSGDIKYIKTVKNKMAEGVFAEDEIEITFDETMEILYQKNLRKIIKERYEYTHDNIHFCFDRYFEFPMLKLEIEGIGYGEYLQTKKRIFGYNPKFLKDILIYEVTGIKEFSNKSLSWKVKE